MADNWLTWYLSATTAAVGGIGSYLGLLYAAERSTDRAWQDYAKFRAQIPSLRKLEEEIGQEAWQWPMYARPVFYTSVDQAAQVYFSNAQRAIYDARRFEQSIKPPPERPTSLRSLLSFANNWNRYAACLDVQQEVDRFNGALQEIIHHLYTLRQSHGKEVALQENTKANLKSLEQKINDTGSKIGGQSRGKKFDDNVDWAQRNANNCFLEAHNQLTLITGDGINFAIADLFIQLGNYIIEHFDLYEKEFDIPVRFELDHFEHHLGLFQKGISVMLSAPIDNWQSLHATARMLVLVNQQMQQSRRSLEIFLGKQQVLHGLEQQLQTIDFPQVVKEIEEVEKECASYWYPPDQDPSIWTEVLGVDPLPSSSLDDARSSFQGNILPLIAQGAVIKQSLITKLIEDMRSFFQKVGLAKINQTRLIDELNIHKQAQIEVNVRLGPTGSTYQRIKELAPIEPDTSLDLERKCILCRKDFDVFQARARKVQGANFPHMLSEMDAFENLCLYVKQQHMALIEALKRQCFESVQRLISFQSEINRYAARKPRIEYDVSETNNKITLSINTYSNDMESYRELNTYLSQLKPLIASAQRDIAQLDKLWQKFVIAQSDTAKILQEMKRMLDEYQASSEQSWPWTQKAYRRALNSARNSYTKHCRELEQIATLDIMVTQAVGMCERLQEEVGRELKAVVSKLEPIQERQEHLENKLSDLMDKTRRTTMFTMTPKNSDLIRQFCSMAVQAENEDSAKINLELAQKVLEQSLQRDEAVRIINNSGVYNEEQNNASGSTVQNAGGDISSFSTD